MALHSAEMSAFLLGDWTAVQKAQSWAGPTAARTGPRWAACSVQMTDVQRAGRTADWKAGWSGPRRAETKAVPKANYLGLHSAGLKVHHWAARSASTLVVQRALQRAERWGHKKAGTMAGWRGHNLAAQWAFRWGERSEQCWAGSTDDPMVGHWESLKAVAWAD